VIEVRSLTKTYGAHRAVDGLSFHAPAGKVTGFLGPNGAGKTTTLRCLLGLARATSGRALVCGRSYRDLDAPRRQASTRAAAAATTSASSPAPPVSVPGASTRCSNWWA
jgi:ABC-type multidrug transport system ATPase subunit